MNEDSHCTLYLDLSFPTEYQNVLLPDALG